MRIRAALIPVVAAALLTGCSTEAGPTPKPAPQPPGPDALRIELDAQMTDQCFRAPTEQDPPNCEKYITQLASTPGIARDLAGGNAALADAAENLRAGVQAYRDNGCTEADKAGPACGQALADVADALRAIEQALPAGSPTSSR